jgi:hypothetical protein
VRRARWLAALALCSCAALGLASAAAEPPAPAVVSAASDGGITHVGQGFLHGLDAGAPDDLVRALHVRNWRVNSVASYERARALGAESITWVISDSWRSSDPTTGGAGFGFGGQGLVPAAAALPLYDEFVKNLVRWSIESGHPVTYWDVFNEPNNGYVGTRDMLLLTFEHAFASIRSVDPAAKVVGPSLSGFLATRPQPPDPAWAHDLDLTGFLDDISAKQLDYSAVSWHEIPGAVGSTVISGGPHVAVGDVATMRTMLAERGLTALAVHVNEYGGPADFAIPGWGVAWFAALEEAHVDVANRACWDSSDVVGGPTHSGCTAGVDGLFLSDGSPTPLYWVHRAYAEMTGTRLAVSVADAGTALLATRAASGEIQILVGRHSNDGGLSTADVPLDVQLGDTAGSARVAVRRIPRQQGALSSPTDASTQELPVSDGRVRLLLPAVADGDAMIVSVVGLPNDPAPMVPEAPHSGLLLVAMSGVVVVARAWRLKPTQARP